MAVLLCTGDTLVAISQSPLASEVEIQKLFECHPRQFLPPDFKWVYIVRKGPSIVPLQIAFLNTKDKATEEPKITKLDFHCELTEEEATEHRTTAKRAAWVSTGVSSTSACLKSMSLQGKKRTIALL